MSTKQIAAYQKGPLFLRDSFLRSPDWRWQQARMIVNSTITGLTRMQPSDSIVLFAVRLQKSFKDPKKRQFIQYKMPKVYQICKLGTTQLNAPLRCQLESCIINNIPQQKIAQRLRWLDKTQVRLYKDLFFDLSGIQGLPGWFQQHLLIPIKGQKGGALFRARALAYYFSVDAAIKSLRFGKSGKAARDAMTQMWKDQRSKRIFDYVAKNLNVPIQVYTNMMQQAIQAAQNRDFTLQLKGQGSSQTTALEYASAIQKGIRGFTQQQINSASASFNKGEDLANKYLKQILEQNKG